MSKHRTPWFKIQAKEDDSPAEVLLYGEISSYYGERAKDFIDAIKALGDRRITLRINSPGGDVFQGMAIYSWLKSRGGVDGCVDGVAASMASVVLMACETVKIPANAMIMIHQASGFMFGTAEEMEGAREVLEKIDSQIVGIYATRTGLQEDELRAMMKKTTYLTGTEAVEKGFADEETEEISLSAKLSGLHFEDRLRTFGELPEALQKISAGGTAPAHPRREPETTKKGNKMEKILKALASAKIIPSAKITDEDEAVQFVNDFAAQNGETISNLRQENETLKNEKETAAEAKAQDAIAVAIKAGKIKDEEGLKARWIKAYKADPEGVQAMLDGMTAAVRPGTEPLNELPGDDINSDEPKTLDEVRALMAKETNPEKKSALARKARELRGHKDFLATN